MGGGIPPLPQYVFMARSLVKHRDIFGSKKLNVTGGRTKLHHVWGFIILTFHVTLLGSSNQGGRKRRDM
jgi:hypothetical protein